MNNVIAVGKNLKRASLSNHEQSLVIEMKKGTPKNCKGAASAQWLDNWDCNL